MKRYAVLIMLFLIGVCAIVSASTNSLSIQEAVASLQEDIRRDTEALVALRARIAGERGRLAQELRSLEKEAAVLRDESARMQRVRREGDQAQARLRERAASAQESLRYAETLLTEYTRAVETRMSPAEAAVAMADWLPLRERLASMDVTEFVETTRDILALAEVQGVARVGGQIRKGMAVDANGVGHEGRFVLMGPLAWFASDAGQVGGLVVARLGSVEPGIHALKGRELLALQQVVDGKSVALPVDVTGGDAIRVDEARLSPVDRLRAGGLIMIPLLLTGAIALLLAVWKSLDLVVLRRMVRRDVSGVGRVLRDGSRDEAKGMANSFEGPLRDIVQEAVFHRDAPREHLEEILHEHVLNVLPRAERHLGALAVLGGVAPLLGLLGTVTGMIHTFQLVTLFGSGDAGMLSGGISEALVTTETGLIIAVPVLLVQAFLARSAKSVVATLERQALRLVNELHAHGTSV